MYAVRDDAKATDELGASSTVKAARHRLASHLARCRAAAGDDRKRRGLGRLEAGTRPRDRTGRKRAAHARNHPRSRCGN